MPACGKTPRTSPACKDTASCAGFAPEPPRGLPAGSPRSIVALASVGWLRADERTADVHFASKRAIRLTAASRFEGMTPQQCLTHQFEFASRRTRFGDSPTDFRQ